jgi:methionyl-tRNA synthetase
VHVFCAADDGVDRAGLDAFCAADAIGFDDHRNHRRLMQPTHPIVGFCGHAQHIGQGPDACVAPENDNLVSIDDFAKLDLRVGTVLACGFVEGSDKLLRFELDAGELGKRQIFSGIRASYGEPEMLVGRNVVFIANLAPRKMRFGISEGMILSAGFDGAGLHLLDADTGAQAGMPVR